MPEGKDIFKASIKDVAEKSGLSVVTVSRVINNLPSVRSRNRDKVLRAMQELGYNPNAAARSLAKGRTDIVGLIIPTLNDTFFNNVVRSINKCLMDNGYFLAISLMEDCSSPDSQINYLIREKRVDGLIVLSPVDEERYIEEAARKNIPFVLLDNQKKHSSAYSVLVDNYKGGYDAARHFIELGHAKIAHIRASSHMSGRERERGFRAAMKDAGMEPFMVEGGSFGVSTGYDTACRWFESGRIPTGIFVADDNAAYGVMDAARKFGLSVPGDISVCGYDDNVLSSQLRPHLTTVRQPDTEMGALGVDILLKLIDGKKVKGHTFMLEPHLIKRESTVRL